MYSHTLLFHYLAQGTNITKWILITPKFIVTRLCINQQISEIPLYLLKYNLIYDTLTKALEKCRYKREYQCSNKKLFLLPRFLESTLFLDCDTCGEIWEERLHIKAFCICCSIHEPTKDKKKRLCRRVVGKSNKDLTCLLLRLRSELC